MTESRRPTGVLLVAPSPPPYGGMALQARLLERLLLRDGVDVRFFASNMRFPEALRFFDRLPGIRTAARFLMVLVQLWREVKSASVVHILAASWVYFFAVVWPAAAIGRLRGKRVVLNYRGGEAAKFFRSFGWAAGPPFQLATVVTAPSEFLAEIIHGRFGVPVSIVPNILDLSRFTYRARTVFRPRFLVTRHLEPMYDVATVVQAFALIQGRHSDASLLIVGSGSEEGRLRRLVSDLELQNVEFLGHVPQEKLPELHASCDFLLNASRVDNFPGALVEASASGLAIVSTCAGGIPFIYTNGVTAALVPLGDAEGIAEAVERILAQPSVGIALTSAGLALARSCDWNEVCRKLYAAYGFWPDSRSEQASVAFTAAHASGCEE